MNFSGNSTTYKNRHVETTEWGADMDDRTSRRKVTGVKYKPRGGGDDSSSILAIPADIIVVSAGPWSCAAEDWFRGNVRLPMEGVKSTSIVWKKPQDGEAVDATALFCGEDDRFGTHCKLKLWFETIYVNPDFTFSHY